MAFYRGPQSPRDDQYISNPLSPPQRNPNRWSASMLGSSDVRGALHRRFTTNTVPTLSPIGQQRRQAAGDVQQMVSCNTFPRVYVKHGPADTEVRRLLQSWLLIGTSRVYRSRHPTKTLSPTAAPFDCDSTGHNPRMKHAEPPSFLTAVVLAIVQVARLIINTAERTEQVDRSCKSPRDPIPLDSSRCMMDLHDYDNHRTQGSFDMTMYMLTEPARLLDQCLGCPTGLIYDCPWQFRASSNNVPT